MTYPQLAPWELNALASLAFEQENRDARFALESWFERAYDLLLDHAERTSYLPPAARRIVQQFAAAGDPKALALLAAVGGEVAEPAAAPARVHPLIARLRSVRDTVAARTDMLHKSVEPLIEWCETSMAAAAAPPATPAGSRLRARQVRSLLTRYLNRKRRRL
jgi:hypothetical protein